MGAELGAAPVQLPAAPAPIARRRRRRWDVVLPHVVAGLGAALALLPLGWLVGLALVDEGPGPWRAGARTAWVDNFTSVVGQLGPGGRWLFGRQLLNSVIVSALVAAISVAAAGGGGWALSRLRFPGRTLARALTFLVPLLPASVLLVPAAPLLQAAGLGDSLTALVLLQLATTVPFATWLAKNAIDRLPPEQEALARLEGMAPAKALRRVVLPQVKGTLGAAGAFAFVASWNEYVIASSLARSEEVRTLAVGVAAWASGPAPHLGAFAAGSLLLAVPPAVAVWVARRHVLAAFGMGRVR